MKILAVDTSQPIFSAGLTIDGKLAAEITGHGGRTHARHLMDSLDRVLEDAGLMPGELNGLAVVLGPGSFTGVRIGIATIQGLALASGIPVAGLSALDALACQALVPGKDIWAVVDARKKQVYAACFRADESVWSQEPFSLPGLVRTREPAALYPEQLLEKLTDNSILVGSGAVYFPKLLSNASARPAFAPPLAHVIRAQTVAAMGEGLLSQNKGLPPSELSPLYLRPPDIRPSKPLFPGPC